ncbi:M20/M25/M40 family metallo-hydrolase [Ferruginibacter sp. SUN106]|uniref:M20/M25/M40 family metallo-hydrolase n=1 Tax=Ferruginibacter sp. SUN106 TaxID=2978348 RepID=UPI003D35E56C
MYKKKLFFSAVLLCSFFTCFSQNDDSVLIKRISDDILLNGKAYSNLYTLCKSVGQRLSGSAGMYKGEAWGQQALKDAGAQNVYLQECMVPHWVRGKKEEAGFKTHKRGMDPSFNVLSIGNAVGTGNAGVTAKVIEVKNFAELEQRKNEVKGNIVFYNYPFNKTYLRGAYGDAVRYRSGGASAAAKYGALAVIVRSVTAATDDNPHTGALRYNDSFPKIPAVAISTKGADELSKYLKGNYKNDQFYIRTNCVMLADTIGHNVVGEIKGTEFPDEIITIGGHMDSWDPAEGANDDGAGMVQSIEILRAFNAIGYKPKRTIRIVLFANEENGGRGGDKYAELAKTKNENHIMAMESDGGSEYPRGFGCGMTKAQFAKVEPWKKYFEPYDADKFSFSEGGGGGSDIGPLQTKFKTAQFGLSTTAQRYFNFHHSAIDVFENVNAQELHLGAAVMAAMVYLVDKYGL